MSVVRLEIQSRTPYETGRKFGAGGAYERLDGTIHFAVDPGDAANRGIVDLDKAERAADSRVHFQSDFCLLQPVDAQRSNRRLLFDVVNRGRRNLSGIFNRSARPRLLQKRSTPVTAFLCSAAGRSHGAAGSGTWCEAQCSWGLRRRRHWKKARRSRGRFWSSFSPLAGSQITHCATECTGPIPLRMSTNWTLCSRCAIGSTARRPSFHEIVGALHANRTAASSRTRPASGSRAGSSPGRFYEVIYRTKTCPVVGSGLLAVRDTVSFLRNGSDSEGNPCAGRIDHAYGYGVSQTGRFLRHFLYLGLNVDEHSSRFLMACSRTWPARAGASSIIAMHSLRSRTRPTSATLCPLQPTIRLIQLPGHRRPVATSTRSRRLAQNHRHELRAEYWRGDGSMLHTDISGTHDLEPPEEMRIYLHGGDAAHPRCSATDLNQSA